MGVRFLSRIDCCKVGLSEAIGDAKRQVAIRFAQRSPHFWGTSSPPEDWNTTEQKHPPKK